MSMLWTGWDEAQIANLYFRSSSPGNSVCHSYFSISDGALVRTLLGKRRWAGRAFIQHPNEEPVASVVAGTGLELELYKRLRGTNSGSAKWLQELLWFVGRWKSPELRRYVRAFNPDVIFSPAFGMLYPHRVLWWIARQTGAKVALFHADDYLNAPVTGSILNRLHARWRARRVLASAKSAELNFCISPKMQAEYQVTLRAPLSLLYKGADFDHQPERRVRREGDPLKLVYAGSLLSGRWRTLGAVARAISTINHEGAKVELTVYSQYAPADEWLSVIDVPGASRFMGSLSSEDVPGVLKDADVVMHVESFDEVERASTRLSFSTKIVDCLNSGRCVMAIGWNEAASIDYLATNHGAFVVNSEAEILDALQRLVDDPQLVEDQAALSWQLGTANHSASQVRARLIAALSSLISDSRQN